MNIVHASDLHFGRPHLPPALDALGRFIAARNPDVVVLSGDLTQRAKVVEFEEARQFVDTLTSCPVITVPGNHDVPVYRVWERLTTPYRNYRRLIADALDTVLDVDGARFVALNTAAPWTRIVNGRLTRRQRAYAAEAFRAAPAHAMRILVLHHHVLGPGDHEVDRTLPDSTEIIRAFHAWGVDMVLAGHLHRAYVKTSDEGLPAGLVPWGIPIIHSGTTTSSRGRGKEKGRNSLNLIRVEDLGIEVSVYLYSEAEDRFLPSVMHRYPRAGPEESATAP